MRMACVLIFEQSETWPCFDAGLHGPEPPSMSTPISKLPRPVRSVASLVLLFCISFAGIAAERPMLAPLFTSNMVLQRGRPNVFWGWTSPSQTVQVQVAGSVHKTTAGSDGSWRLQFDPPPVGGPYVVRVRADREVVLDNVLVGDVWLCSGQSNMSWGILSTDTGSEAVKTAQRPNLRLFVVRQQPAYGPKASLSGVWKVCTPESLAENGGFSAVAYFFAERIQREVDVPIGLVQSAVGGSPIESWMSDAALNDFPEFARAIDEIIRLRNSGAKEYGNYITHWYDQYEVGTKDGQNWAAEELDSSSWTPVKIPGGFAELGVPDEPAVCWFRREVVLPDPLPAGPAKIKLGVVEKMDTTFVNGTWVGASSWVENPRSYAIPAGVLRPGKNVVAVRVFKLRKNGGFQSAADKLQIELGDGTVVPLAGDWLGKLSVDARSPHPLPLGFENYPTMPTVLYNGMIAPIAPAAIAGALWYQGEANFTRAYQYRRLLPGMVADWRKQFQQPNLPFFVVGLPAFMQKKDQPTDDGWAELRDAQLLAARTVPGVEVATTIDTGDANDIHPRDKQPVGERLALLALARYYGKDVPYSGPRYVAHQKQGATLRIRFERVAGSLVQKGDRLSGFSIAGPDRKWHWAKAQIDGDFVVVSSPDVPDPVAVRYAWQANPDASLFDEAGLPAHPFRTDDWPLSTQPR
jgi:sialate O-acetylesterase